MNLRRISTGWLVGAAVLIVLLLLPLILGRTQLGLPTEILIFGIFALTYDLVFGYTGLISFGQALFVGLGAYALTIAMTDHGVAFWPAVLIVLVAGIIISALTGLLALRTRGVYFAMVTLAFAQAAFTLAQTDVGGLTHGENGIVLAGAPEWLTGTTAQTHFYYVALAALVCTFLLLRLFVLSPAGRVWQAIRDNEQRSLMIGYNPFVFKLLSYVISGTICSLGGALYALYIGAVSTNLLTADLTIRLLLMVIIGGAGSLWGAMLGAGIVQYLNKYLNDLATAGWVASLPDPLPQTIGQPLLLFGVIYLLLVYFFPQGIAGLVQRWSIFRPHIPAVGIVESEAQGPLLESEEAADQETQHVETLPGG